LLRKFGGYTLPDFLGERFGGTPARVASVLLLILCSFPLLVASVYGLGLAGSRLFGVELATSLSVAVALPLISTVFGGMRAVSVTQVAQGVVLLLATLAAIAIFKGQQGLALQDHGGITAAIEAFSLRDRTDQVALLVSLIAGAASFPHLLMHSFLTPKVDGARISFLWAGLFIVVLGVAAAAYPGLLAAMGLDADRPLAAYVLCIAVIAACLALAAGLLAAIANTLAYDFYFKTFDRTATTTRQLLVARGALVLVAAFAGFSALEAGSAATGLAAASFSLAASAFFPALLLGLWWARVNAAGALAGMAAGILLCLYYLLVPHYLPVLFYETTRVLSNASPEQAAHYAILKQAYLLAGGSPSSRRLRPGWNRRGRSPIGGAWTGCSPRCSRCLSASW
jgi:cation/acetate symporter